MSDDGKESRAPLITAGNNIHHDELPKPPQGQLYDAIHNSHSHDFQGLYSPLSPSDAPPYQSRPNERFDDDDDDDARSSSSSELERGIKKHHQQQQQQQQHDTATTEEEFAPIPRYRVEWTTIVKHKWPAIFTAVVAVQAIICLAFESYVCPSPHTHTSINLEFDHVPN
jgi:hypothetical protein